MIIESSAPTRVDLAGGTIDIPPLYLFHEGATTVNFAIDMMARCRIETSRVEATHTLELPEGNRTTDQALIKLSLADHAILITKDSDFVQSFLLKREPWKLLLVSTGEY